MLEAAGAPLLAARAELWPDEFDGLDGLHSARARMAAPARAMATTIFADVFMTLVNAPRPRLFKRIPNRPVAP